MPPHALPLRVAVIGAGAFGRNHLRVYRELELAHPTLVKLAALVEPDTPRREALAATYNIPAFPSVTEMLAAPHLGSEIGVDAASICVPTVHHAAVAGQLLPAGIDLLIEKPIASTLLEAQSLLALARQHNRILAVGHLERFNPAVTAALAALNHPMFFEAHRLSIFTPRSLDVDVVLDLMIHDLDIVLTLAQSTVTEVRAVGLPVLSPRTDIANVRLEFASGCIANFTASRVSTEQVRKLRLFQPHQYLSLDFARQELLTINVDPALAAAMASVESSTRSTGDNQVPQGRMDPATTLSAKVGTGDNRVPQGFSLGSHTPPKETGALAPEGTPHPSAGLSLQKSDIPRAEPLRLELLDFLHAVRDRTQPRVPAEAGIAALALALQINAAIATHAQRTGLA